MTQNDKELELFRKFVSEFFYIDYDGTVRESFNECYEVSEDKDLGEFCEMIKKYIKDDWQKEQNS